MLCDFISDGEQVHNQIKHQVCVCVSSQFKADRLAEKCSSGSD